MAIATEHAMAISQNILLLAGRREGKLKQIKLNEHAGLSALAVSLGKGMGLLYATDPNLASFFGDAEGLRAAHGEMSEAGKAGWKELTPAIEYMKIEVHHVPRRLEEAPDGGRHRHDGAVPQAQCRGPGLHILMSAGYHPAYIINKYNVKYFVFSTVQRSALCFNPEPRSPLQMQCAAD
eukprot:scaffold3984_cov65-Phaeocystis_antarctica.AAC.4